MYAPHYRNGKFVSVSAPGVSFVPDDTGTEGPKFAAWLRAQGLTLDAWLAANPDPETQADRDNAAKLAALTATDAGVIRGVDDIWAFLIAKNFAKPEDRPAQLAEKLDARAILRAELDAEVAKL